MSQIPTSSSSINKRPILEDGSGSWSKVPYQVKFGREFMDTIESSKYLAGLKDADGKTNIYTEGIAPKGLADADATEFEKYLGYNEGIISKTRKYYRDSRVGGNEAINCVWQFNCDDDIVYPLTMTEGTGNDAEIGMGRVYAQTTELNQTIGYFTFGVPRYADMSAFYLNMFSKELIELNNNGTSGAMQSIARFLLDAAVFAITFPIRAVGWAYSIITRSQHLNVNRFYSLRTTMHLYYRYVDSILSHWLINTNILTMPTDDDKSRRSNEADLPLALQLTGPSMYHIRARMAQTAGQPVMDQEAYRQHIDDIVHMTPEDYDKKQDGDGGFFSWISDWWNSFSKTALGASTFIGFRINKDTDASESFSNSSRPNQIAEQFNSQVREFYNKMADAGTFGQTAAEAVKGVASAASAIFSGSADGAVAQIASAATGGAFVDVPEMWSGSDFSKSHSISLQLRSPYGDPVSIFQSIMVPLACILAGVMPRAAGANSYQQPFYCRYFVKGISSVSCGLIESVQIKRGASEFGWTHEGLPTAVDVNITIKDMSPILAMSMVLDGYENIFCPDNAFQEYMLTLAGVSLYDRVARLGTLVRHFRQNMLNLRNTIFNKYYFTSMLADSAMVQAIAAFIPISYVPRR